MKKFWILPLAAAVIGLVGCSSSSGTALTVNNAKDWFSVDEGNAKSPAANTAGGYDAAFSMSVTNGKTITSDTKGTLTFTLTIPETKLTETKSLVVNKVNGTFAATGSKSTDGSETFYLGCTVTFSFSADTGYAVSSLAIISVSDLAFVTISGSVNA